MCLLKSSNLIMVFSGVVLLSSCSGGPTPERMALDSGGYSELAQSVFSESNKLRTRPDAYVGVLKAHRGQFRGDVIYREGSPVGIVTDEGVSAVDEAISVIQEQEPLKPMRWSEKLAELARLHVEDTGRKGLVGHGSSNGDGFSERLESLSSDMSMRSFGENISYGASSGRDVVVQLVVDDGVASRGHRENLLNAKFNISGVGCGYHKRYGSMCVAIYGSKQ